MNGMQLIWLLKSVRMLLIFSGNGVLFFPDVLITPWLCNVHMPC